MNWLSCRGDSRGREPLILVLAVLSFYSAVAVAESTNPLPTTPAIPGGVIWLIAYLTRRQQIGGWLMVFYIGLYVGAAITVVSYVASAATIAHNFDPANWSSASDYLIFVLGAAPGDLALIAEIIVASIMLRFRNEVYLRRLRVVLVIGVAAHALGLTLSFAHPSASDQSLNLFIDGYGLIVTGIWAAYFYQSERVRRVFIEGHWKYPPAGLIDTPTTPRERAYLRKRSAIVGTGVFLAVAAAIGFGSGPWSVALVSGLVCGGIAALIARYLELSQSTRRKLSQDRIVA